LAGRGEGKAAVGGLAMLALVGLGHRSAGSLEQRFVQRTLADSYYFGNHTPYWALRPTSSTSELRKEVDYGWSVFLVEPGDRASELANALSVAHERHPEVLLARWAKPFTVPLVFGPAALLRRIELEQVGVSVRSASSSEQPGSARPCNSWRMPRPCSRMGTGP
jgi:hypothetical protein